MHPSKGLTLVLRIVSCVTKNRAYLGDWAEKLQYKKFYSKNMPAERWSGQTRWELTGEMVILVQLWSSSSTEQTAIATSSEHIAANDHIPESAK